MKKVGELMKEMGFNPESSENTQKAFIKYLIRVANKGKHQPEPFFSAEAQEEESWQELKTHSKNYESVSAQARKNSTSVPEQKPQQLCFTFIEKKSDSEAS